MEYPRVAILILHYGQIEFTKKCIQSLLQNDYKSYYILILDNSGLRQLDLLWFNKLQKTSIYYAKQNMGFAAGCNFLASKALIKNFDYLLFLNNDTQVDSKLIIELVKIANNQKDTGAVGCAISYLQNPQKIWFAGGYLDAKYCFTRHYLINKSISSLKKLSKTRIIDWVTGCCMLISVQNWRKIGVFDTDYQSYFEDVDWCYRAKTKGLRNIIINQILLKHAVSASFGIEGSNNLTVNRAYYYARNPLLFIKKYLKGYKKNLALCGQTTFVLAYYVINMLKTKNTRSIISYLNGLYAGFKNK